MISNKRSVLRKQLCIYFYINKKNGKRSIKQRKIAKKTILVLFLIFQGGGYVCLHFCHGGGHIEL